MTDHATVVKSIGNFVAKRTAKELKRRDIVDLYRKYGNNDGIANMMIERFNEAKRTGTLNHKPVVVRTLFDDSSQKWRKITIEDIVRQLFDQLATDGLEEATKCVGEYQCTCLRNQPQKVRDPKTGKPKINPDTGKTIIKYAGRGQVWAAEMVSRWMAEPDVRQIIKADVYHNYDSIDHDMLFAMLNHDIKNDDLILLVHLQIDEFGPVGIPIGSVLSITLDAIYISRIYHHMAEKCYKIRKHRDGTSNRANLVKHILIWMDDIYLFCTSKKNAESSKRELIRYSRTLKLKIKPSIQMIDKIDPPKHPNIHQAMQSYVDVVGYRVYPDHITLRRKNYISAKRNLKSGRKHMTLHRARSIMAQRGTILHSNSYRFRKKYKTKQVWKKARKVVSEHDKSNFHRKTAQRPNDNNGRKNICPDLCKRSGENRG